MNLLLAFLAFNAIVLIHELGHFIAAKKMGIKVLEFSLFIGPKIFSIQRGETTYSLRLLPIIAYVKMEGEEEASASPRAFNNKPPSARALTIFAGPFANLLLAVIMLTVVFSYQGFATTKVSGLTENSPAASVGIEEGAEIVKYDGKRVYMTLDVIQFLYVSKGRPVEIEYISDGKRMSRIITPTVIPAKELYRIGASFAGSSGKDSNVIQSVAKGYPAKAAGFMPGDRIIKINETDINSYEDLIKTLEANKGKTMTITLLRQGSEIKKEITPKLDKIPEQYDIGMYFAVEKGNIIDAFRQSCIYTYSICRSTAYSLVWLLTGQVELNQMMGPVGMVSTIGTVVEQVPDFAEKIISLLQITALISIAVGATNLIPFPMLDGNKLLLIGIEAVRKKPINPDREAAISMIGFGALMIFFVFVTYNDIVRIITGY